MLNYDPESQYDVNVFDVTYRSAPDGALPARIYQPRGEGPFPAVLDVHGGAWNRGHYLDNQRIDHALAASGLVVAAIEFRQAPAHTCRALRTSARILTNIAILASNYLRLSRRPSLNAVRISSNSLHIN